MDCPSDNSSLLFTLSPPSKTQTETRMSTHERTKALPSRLCDSPSTVCVTPNAASSSFDATFPLPTISSNLLLFSTSPSACEINNNKMMGGGRSASGWHTEQEEFLRASTTKKAMMWIDAKRIFVVRTKIYAVSPSARAHYFWAGLIVPPGTHQRFRFCVHFYQAFYSFDF